MHRDISQGLIDLFPGRVAAGDQWEDKALRVGNRLQLINLTAEAVPVPLEGGYGFFLEEIAPDSSENFLLHQIASFGRIRPEPEAIKARLSLSLFKLEHDRDAHIKPVPPARLPLANALQIAPSFESSTYGVRHRFAHETESFHERRLSCSIPSHQKRHVVQDETSVREGPIMAKPKFFDLRGSHGWSRLSGFLVRDSVHCTWLTAEFTRGELPRAVSIALIFGYSCFDLRERAEAARSRSRARHVRRSDSSGAHQGRNEEGLVPGSSPRKRPRA